MSITGIPKKQMDELWADRLLRVETAKLSFFHFLVIYMAHRFELDPADFHMDMINALDSVDDMNKYLAVLGFRGSAKSTVLEAFAIWSMLNGRHNFIVYIRATIEDSKMSLANIRGEIEENGMLRADFGIMLESQSAHGFREKWSESQLTIGDCTIIAKSRGQKVRGVKFKKARIDLIIADDLEDVIDADTVEKRQKTRAWFFTEVMQATKQGVEADNVKIVLLGNLVHRDCLIKHLSRSKLVRTLEFGILLPNGEPSWPGLYPTRADVEKKHQEVLIAGEGMGAVIWAREFLLKDADEEDMILKPSEIKYYPDEWLLRKPEASGVGVDFAISQKQTADYTAMCKAMDVKNDDGERRLLIMKNPLQARLTFETTIAKAVEIDGIMAIRRPRTRSCARTD